MESENLGELWVTVYIDGDTARVDIQDVIFPISMADAKALITKHGPSFFFSDKKTYGPKGTG